MPDTEHIKQELKKFDNFTKEKKPHGSWMAGALQLGAWFATGILLLTYSITNTNAEWPFGSQIIPFPSSVLENKCFPYPDIKCIHKQGCLFFPDFLKISNSCDLMGLTQQLCVCQINSPIFKLS